jgi:hypothetical protein
MNTWRAIRSCGCEECKANAELVQELTPGRGELGLLVGERSPGDHR